MTSDSQRQTLDIVREIWADDCEILGVLIVTKLAENPGAFQSPSTGDKLDLAPILDTVKSAIELVTACLALYAAARAARNSSAEAEKEVETKLDESEGKGSLTRDQAVSLLKLIAGRG